MHVLKELQSDEHRSITGNASGHAAPDCCEQWKGLIWTMFILWREREKGMEGQCGRETCWGDRVIMNVGIIPAVAETGRGIRLQIKMGKGWGRAEGQSDGRKQDESNVFSPSPPSDHPFPPSGFSPLRNLPILLSSCFYAPSSPLLGFPPPLFELADDSLPLCHPSLSLSLAACAVMYQVRDIQC